jgi:hypothetical protein
LIQKFGLASSPKLVNLELRHGEKLQRSWGGCNAETECNAVNETERERKKERQIDRETGCLLLCCLTLNLNLLSPSDQSPNCVRKTFGVG